MNFELGELPDHTPLPIKITLNRLIQEALNNSFHHAQGKGQKVKDEKNRSLSKYQTRAPDLISRKRSDWIITWVLLGCANELKAWVEISPYESGRDKVQRSMRYFSTFVWKEPKMNDKIRVVIVDDHPLFREGVATILGNEPAFEVIGQGKR